MFRASAIALALAVACVLAAACGGGGDAPDDGAPAAASLLFGTIDGHIVDYDLTTNTTSDLAVSPAGANLYFRDPAVSRDGVRFVYVAALPLAKRDGKQDASNDLWIANRDGTDGKVAYTHRDLNETLYAPQWEDDSHVLVTARTAPDRSSLDNVTFRLLRINVDDGTAETALDQVNTFGFAKQQQRIAFSRVLTFPGFTDETLNIAGVDGSNAKMLLPGSQSLAFFGTPRISPDGARVAFFALTRALALAPKEASENAPAELWVIGANGSDLSKVAEFDARETSPPGIAWRSDGAHVYVAGEAGVFDVDLETGFADKLSPTKATGAIALAP